MNIRHIFMTIAAIMLASAAVADSSSVTSKKYVDDFIAGYQNKIPGSGADKLMIYDDTDGISAKQIVSSLSTNTSATNIPDVGAVKGGLDGKQDTINGSAGYVMTGTGTAGDVGERAIYGTGTNHVDALVTAGTVNTAVTNAVNNSLIRVDENGDVDPDGTLWQIADDLIALNVCSNYISATGTGVQDGTPTPTHPIMPTFYQQGGMVLRKVGDYADSYDENTNKITRRVGVKVLDGTENWVAGGSGITGMYNLAIDNLFAEVANVSNRATPYSTHFKRSTDWLSLDPRSGSIMGYRGSRAFIGLGYGSVSQENLPAFKSWLADQYANGTPVVVYYPLETPVEESMPPRCQ